MTKGVFGGAARDSRAKLQDPDDTEGQGMKIEGSTILVTGASSGIGAALAPQLSERGATVGIVARRADRLDEVLARCREHAPESRAVAGRPRRPRARRTGRARSVGRVRTTSTAS